MRSTIAILNTSRSGPWQSLTMVGYSSVLPKTVEDRKFKSESQSLSPLLVNPDKAPSFNVSCVEVI